MGDTYKLEELARAAGVAARTIRYYVQRGLLPAPEFRGKDTAYGHEHLLRLQAIQRLQALHLPLDAIQARLAALSSAELAGLATGGPERLAADVPPAPRRGPRTPVPTPASLETWQRITLAPGLELHLRADAGPHARALALAIQTLQSASVEDPDV